MEWLSGSGGTARLNAYSSTKIDGKRTHMPAPIRLSQSRGLGCCRVAKPPCNTPRSRFPLPWVGVLWLSQDTALFAVDFEKALPAPTGKRPSRSLLSRVFSGHATRRVYPKGPAPRAQCPPEPMWAEMWVAQAYGRIESENIYMIPAITSNENISAVTTTIILFFIGDMPYWVR